MLHAILILMSDSRIYKRQLQFLVVIAAFFVASSLWRKFRAQNHHYWRRFQRLVDVVCSPYRLLAQAADTFSTVLEDTQAFLKTDTDELPRFLTQSIKAVSSAEMHEALLGYMRTFASIESSGPSFVDKVIEACLSNRGQNLILQCVSRGVSDFVEIVADRCMVPVSNQPSTLDGLLHWLGTPVGQLVTKNSISTFVRHGMEVYCDKTTGGNVYDDLLVTMSKAEHLRTMQALTKTFCNAAISATFKRRGREDVHPLAPRRIVRAPHEDDDDDDLEEERIPLSMKDDRENIAVLHNIPTAKSRHAASNGSMTVPQVNPFTEQVIILSKVPEWHTFAQGCSRAACSGAAEGVVNALSSCQSGVSNSTGVGIRRSTPSQKPCELPIHCMEHATSSNSVSLNSYGSVFEPQPAQHEPSSSEPQYACLNDVSTTTLPAYRQANVNRKGGGEGGGGRSVSRFRGTDEYDE